MKLLKIFQKMHLKVSLTFLQDQKKMNNHAGKSFTD